MCTLGIFYRRPLDQFLIVLLIVVALLFDYYLTPVVRDLTLSSWTVDLCWSIECSHYPPLDSQKNVATEHQRSRYLIDYLRGMWADLGHHQ
jgi:hypothetical protein